ncbi:hypothetical protein VSR82_07890 [Burkholderia sp. JPY481]
MADLFDGSQGAGLMGLYANPQTAGLLGLGQGLLAASGPSRIPVSMGQALGSGVQGLQQGIGNAVQNQRQMLMMQALQGALGGQGGQPASAPTMTPSPAVTGASNTGPMSGLMAGMGSAAPMPQAAAQNAQAAYPAAPQGAAGSIFGNSPQQLWRQGYALSLAGLPVGAEMMKMAAQYDPTLQAQLPTDATKMGTQAGMTGPQIQQANADALAKTNALSIRPGGGVLIGNRFVTMPGAAPAGYMNQQGPDGSWSVVPVQGGAEAVRGSAAAQAGGKAQYNLQQVWDPTANGGQGGFVYQSTANVADATGGNGAAPTVPVGIRNNNFGNIKGADGQFATYATPQDGINAADQTLATYGAKHGINTIAGIANRWAPKGDGNNDPAAKAAAISAASGVGVNQPINLSDPATRARILPALFDTETPGWRNAMGGGAPAAQGAPAHGPMAAQPPLGQTSMSNEAQAASAKVMADDYQNMQGVRQNAPTVLQAYDHLLDLAKTGGWQGWAANGGLTGKLMSTDAATYASPAAAEYDKTRAFLINAGGAAMGDHNTDAARANLDRMIPEFGKPTQAKLDGIMQGRNQVAMSALRANVMTPLFQSGDSKAYTGLANQFDTTVKPEMMPTIAPIMQMTGPQQQAAVQAAVKANPALKPAFETLFNAGMLK